MASDYCNNIGDGAFSHFVSPLYQKQYMHNAVQIIENHQRKKLVLDYMLS